MPRSIPCILFLLFSLLFAAASGFVAWQVLRSEPGPGPSTAEGELPTVRASGDAGSPGSPGEEVTAPGPGAAGGAEARVARSLQG